MMRNRGDRRIRAWIPRLVGLVAACAATGSAVAPVAADVFHLEGGGALEGQLLSAADGHYTIRTTVGVVRIPILSVKRVAVADTPFEDYDARVQRAADTPADQASLAEWCDEQGLRAEARRHWQRALELNPDCAPARRALGYVRVGDLWVDGRRRAAAPRDTAAASAPAEDPARVARVIQAQWRQRIRAIKRSFLDSSTPRLLDEGRLRILEIRDPLAILPLAETLGAGNPLCRQVLVAALAAFPDDEATMNLAILGLLDPEFDVREQALHEVARRQDPRVIAQYRDALRTGDDVLVGRAAAALGFLAADEAVPDLIDALTVARHKWVEVPTRRWVQFWPALFTAPIIICYSGVTLALHEPQIGVCRGPAWGQWAVGANRWAYRRVTVRRTEVLEALKRITGENFGFERERWRRWYAGRDS